jgi:ribonuclease J
LSGCRITFYGGVNEVGGNKVLLDDNGTRVLLDFGKGFSRRARFFEEYLRPRSANGHC